MMNTNEFFGLKPSEINNTKLHFATGYENNDEALKEFLNSTIKQWQERQSQKNFNRDYILTLIYLNPGEWLYGGVYKVLKVEKTLNGDEYKYTTELLDKGKKYIGRLIVGFNKQFRQSYPYCENYIDQFKIIEIKRNKYQLLDFPGYENVNISFNKLKLIIKTENRRK